MGQNMTRGQPFCHILPLCFFICFLMITLSLVACGFSEEGRDNMNDTNDPNSGVGTDEAGRLISFEYMFSTFRYRPFVYSIRREISENGDERIFFKADGYSNGLIDVDTEIDETVIDQLVGIIEEENIFAWDGFDRHNKDVRDGFSFSLRVEFENKKIKASGYMEYPENFKESHERLSGYLLSLTGARQEE